MMNTMTARDVMTRDVETSGNTLHELREAALERNMPFVAGILRGAEESVLVAWNMLKNPETADKEL